ncbi:MAG TPA: hypothetical protein VM935_00630 [Chitinophagaceae bacterium]|jgi:hypothetical protein|nr:hypothetical protein [Chitinophagaceae bacterium]
MGRIKRFNLRKLIDISGAEFFFETGTWRGDGLAYAARYPFQKLYSSEIIESVATKAKKRFEHNSKVTIVTGSSTEALQTITPSLNASCVFWLDAHFPGAEEGLKEYNEFEDETIKLPLEKEMEIIAKRTSRFQDIILVDDLRIYEEANYESGNLPENVLPPKVRNVDFVTKMFGRTHTIIRSIKDEGYLIVVPKSLLPLPFWKKILYDLQAALTKKIF